MPDSATSPGRTEENRRRGPRITTGMFLVIDIGIALALWGLLWLAVSSLSAIWP